MSIDLVKIERTFVKSETDRYAKVIKDASIATE
jgi:hypothetical protein